MTAPTPTKDSRERSPDEHFARERSPDEHLARADGWGHEQDQLIAQIQELRLQGLNGDQIADSLQADRVPPLMQVTTFLMWLDKASLDELESFGQDGTLDTGICYDPFNRMYSDYETSVRWTRE